MTAARGGGEHERERFVLCRLLVNAERTTPCNKRHLV